jgi:hypothetical protein
MGEESYENVVYSRNVLEFVTVCNEYCTYIEQVETHAKKDLVPTLQKVLPLLYLKATMLPTINETSEEIPEKFVTEVDYHFLLGKLEVKLGEHDAYQEVFDPNIQYSEGPVAGSIAENVMDIYQDVKDFLMAYRIGTEEVMEGALEECQQNFKHYWGQRLVNCLRALHSLVYGDVDLEDEGSTQKPKKKKDEPSEDSPLLRNHYDHFNDQSEGE